VYDFGVGEHGLPYFTMKRVRGETLGHILERLNERDAAYTARYSRHKLLAAFRQACLAVEYAHLRGVVHRDLKPSNIMLGDFGEVYVLDWGLAKLRADDEAGTPSTRLPLAEDDSVSDRRRSRSDAEKTGEGDLIGTPAYMAPEQFGSGRTRFDTRQDIFALGAILFELLTLARYRPGASFATLLPSLLHEADRAAPLRPSERVADVSPELDEMCAQALATKPAERLASAGAIAEVIERYLEGDRDEEMRKALASKLLTEARAQAMGGGTKDATARLEAMRSAIKALALTPDDPVAQRFLLSLVVDGSGELPKEAERELEVADFQVDAHTLRLAFVGLGSWFLTLPLAMWVGIRSWAIVLVMAVLTAASMVYVRLVLRWQTRARRHFMLMATMLAATLSCTSAWLGPFILVPVATATIVILFAVRSRPGERVGLVVIWVLALVVPFVLELLHVVPPSYTFRDGNLILHPRAFDLPEVPTLAALVYTSLGFMVLPLLLLSRVRDKERDGDRKLFVQAWHLRQLFPEQAEDPRK
jgi:serine/threonine-protein kinase